MRFVPTRDQSELRKLQHLGINQGYIVDLYIDNL